MLKDTPDLLFYQFYRKKFTLLLGLVSSCVLIFVTAIISDLDTLTKYSDNKQQIENKTETELSEIKLLANYLGSKYPSESINISIKPWISSDGETDNVFLLWVHFVNPQFIETELSSNIRNKVHEIALSIYAEYPHIDTYEEINIGITEVNDGVIITSTESSTYSFQISELEKDLEE